MRRNGIRKRPQQWKYERERNSRSGIVIVFDLHTNKMELTFVAAFWVLSHALLFSPFEQSIRNVLQHTPNNNTNYIHTELNWFFTVNFGISWYMKIQQDWIFPDVILRCVNFHTKSHIAWDFCRFMSWLIFSDFFFSNFECRNSFIRMLERIIAGEFLVVYLLC